MILLKEKSKNYIPSFFYQSSPKCIPANVKRHKVSKQLWQGAQPNAIISLPLSQPSFSSVGSTRFHRCCCGLNPTCTKLPSNTIDSFNYIPMMLAHRSRQGRQKGVGTVLPNVVKVVVQRSETNVSKMKKMGFNMKIAFIMNGICLKMNN